MKPTRSLTGIVLGLLSASATVMARSSVYVVSSNELKTTTATDTPTIPVDAFSLLMSQMTDTEQDHPVMHWQKTYREQTVRSARAVWTTKNDNIFDRKLESSLLVIVPGVEEPQAILPGYEPAFYVSDDYSENYMAIAEDTADSVRTHGGRAFLAPELHSFSVDHPELDSEVFDLNSEIDTKFAAQVNSLGEILNDAQHKENIPDFAGIQFTGLRMIGEKYGTDSIQYDEAQRIVRNIIEESVIPQFQSLCHGDKPATIVFVFSPMKHASLHKRDIPGLLQEDDTTCYKSQEACENGTASCSGGRGSCVASETDGCYTCQCKSSAYLGSACEIEDVVADFQLLFWTSVGLIAATSGVLLFVYKSGNIENGGIMLAPQSLPKQD